MSVPRFKRKPSGLDYVNNAFNLQVEIMNLCSKLSVRCARIYQQPIDRLACYHLIKELSILLEYYRLILLSVFWKKNIIKANSYKLIKNILISASKDLSY